MSAVGGLNRRSACRLHPVPELPKNAAPGPSSNFFFCSWKASLPLLGTSRLIVGGLAGSPPVNRAHGISFTNGYLGIGRMFGCHVEDLCVQPSAKGSLIMQRLPIVETTLKMDRQVNYS